MAEMMVLGQLRAVVNGHLLDMQHTIELRQHVGQPIHITICSAASAKGLEFNFHERVGERVNVAIMLAPRFGDGEVHHVLAIDAIVVGVQMTGGDEVDTCVKCSLRQVTPPLE